MENLTLIIALSAVLWFIVDKFKPLWAEKSWGKYITMAVAAFGGFGLTFAFDLDLAVDVIGQKRQSQHFEQQLKIGLADGKEIGCTF